MRKIPTIYERDQATKLRYVKNERHPDCGWVFAGEGVATYKWDGTAVRIDDHGVMWKRRQVKADEPVPEGFDQEGDADPETGKRVGWVVCQPVPEDRWHFEALGYLIRAQPVETPWPTGDVAGTYELVGPKIHGNPHLFSEHRLIQHGEPTLISVPTEFDVLGRWLHSPDFIMPGFEGVVWHHPTDGRMAKIKAKDFPR